MTAQLTISVPDELATKLRPRQNELVELLELGLRQRCAGIDGAYSGFVEVLETFASLRAPEVVAALRPSQDLQKRINFLLDKNRTNGLTQEEEKKWQQ